MKGRKKDKGEKIFKVILEHGVSKEKLTKGQKEPLNRMRGLQY